jgi:hypothetical protein
MTPTSLPELSSSHPVFPRASFAAEGSQSFLALLGKLEASLAASQTALLLLDVTELEGCTEEQRTLCRQIENSCSFSAYASPLNEGLPDKKSPLARHSDQIALCATQARVLHLARVQGALLRRAQRSLRVVASLTVGATYAPQQWRAVPQP